MGSLRVKQQARSASSSSEEVRVSAGVALAGTFVAAEGARSAALVLSGSGKLDRDSNGPRLRGEIGSAIADALARDGVSSLRYDKRGAGASGGDFFAAGLSDNYADARSAINWLAERCPGLPLYAIGHSEGALHAARLASEEQVAGAVMIACAARRGEQILTWQAAQIVPTLSATTKTILRLLRIDPLRSQQKAFARLRSTTATPIRIQGRKVNARWLREFMNYDPAPMLNRIRAPLLVLIGEHDMQVPPEDAETIKALVQGPCEIQVIEGMSHILRSDPDARGPRAYRTALKQPVSQELLDAITVWLGAQLEQPA